MLSYRFWVPKSSQHGPQNRPKSLQNRSRQPPPKPLEKISILRPILGLFFIDFWSILETIFVVVRTALQSFHVKLPNQKTTVKHRVLHQKWHLRRSNIDTKLSKNGLRRHSGSTSKTMIKKRRIRCQFSSHFGAKIGPSSFQNRFENWYKFCLHLDIDF